MVDAVHPRMRADAGRPGTSRGVTARRRLFERLRAFARRLLWAMQESRRRQAAIIVKEWARRDPPRSDGDQSV
jgi:hypothetical protein